MNVVGYLRVSTDEQGADDKFGLDAQREKIQRYCDKNGMRIVKWYQDKISGTGLDMAIVKELVEQMGGQIEVQSELGKGTTVYVMIPCEIISSEKKTEMTN